MIISKTTTYYLDTADAANQTRRLIEIKFFGFTFYKNKSKQ